MHRFRFVPVAVLTAAVFAVALLAAGTGGGATKTTAASGKLTWFSNQLGQIQEAEAVRNVLLKGFDRQVDYIPASQENQFIDRIVSEGKAGKVSIDLIGALHGSFVALSPYLTDIGDVAKQLEKEGIPKDFMTLGKLGTSKQLYIPWIQATYLMVANKKALKYLPKGAKLNTLTYGQLRDWAKNMKDQTGQARLGFPASPNGLIHRFFQGYLVPAFSGGVVTTFKGGGSAQAWQYMRSVWKYVHPQALSYAFMQDPLLSEEVLVAWEHVARLKNALEARPNDFVVFAPPKGPFGRAYMPVLAGLAVPKGAPDPAGAKSLIRFLDGVSTQAKTLSTTGFFPVVGHRLSSSVSPGLRLEANALKILQKSKDAKPALLPIGLGAEGGNFNKVYRDTFIRIVLNGEEVGNVLKDEAGQLQAIMNKTGAPCWRPDPPSNGACQVK